MRVIVARYASTIEPESSFERVVRACQLSAAADIVTENSTAASTPMAYTQVG
ncbi:MAG: hypothetical protein H0V96_04260 [Acidimicrobiia bacterium]|nr:hypothetical protein [Acidimicrobiia bacterium]